MLKIYFFLAFLLFSQLCIFLPSLTFLSIILFIFFFYSYPSSLFLILCPQLSSSFQTLLFFSCPFFLTIFCNQFKCAKVTATMVIAAYVTSSNSASGLKSRSKPKSVTLCQFLGMCLCRGLFFIWCLFFMFKCYHSKISSVVSVR